LTEKTRPPLMRSGTADVSEQQASTVSNDRSFLGASLDTAADLWSRTTRLIYTEILRRRFRRWGTGSRVAPPMYVRNPSGIEVGRDVTILEHAVLNVRDSRKDGRATLTIGDGVVIGRYGQINAYQDIVIEPYVLITHRVMISDGTHIYSDPTRPILVQGVSFKAPVLLRTGCWIGAGVVIRPGVTIGRNAVIGANAVVTHDVPDFCVAAGVPARVIRRVSESPSAEECR